MKRIDDEIRRVVFDLSPPDLASLGLAPTLQRYVRTLSALFGRDCAFNVTGKPSRLYADRELALFRFAQETLSNAYKYAGQARIGMDVRFCDGRLTITVDDEGPGFDHLENSRDGRFGLESIRRNAQRANGSLEMVSRPGVGTVVSLTVPIAGA